MACHFASTLEGLYADSRSTRGMDPAVPASAEATPLEVLNLHTLLVHGNLVAAVCRRDADASECDGLVDRRASDAAAVAAL